MRLEAPRAGARAPRPIVSDWDGGTRIGDALQAFLAVPRFAGYARGAAVARRLGRAGARRRRRVADAVARLSRRAWRMSWLTPLASARTSGRRPRRWSPSRRFLDDMVDGGSTAAIVDHVLSLGRRRSGVIPIVDGHHHIWRQADLPWLIGPMQPRIFGPYEPIRRDYPIEEYLRRHRRARRRQVGLCADQLGARALRGRGRLGAANRRQRPAGRTRSSPTPISASTTCARSSTGWRAIRSCAACACNCTGTRTRIYRFAARPDLAADPTIQRNIGAARRLWLVLRPAGVRAADGRTPPASPKPVPSVTFVLQHAGMLEDLSPAGRARMARRHGRGSRRCPNVVSQALGPRHVPASQRSGAYRRSRARDRLDLRRRPLPVRLELSDREAVDRATPSLVGAYRAAARASAPEEQRGDPRTTRRCGSIGSPPDGRRQRNWGGTMALEIKILDYGDIELESSFLVLGRDCGRTRRVLTLGFLSSAAPYPILVDTGYRSNQIMETLGMRGLQFHENMIENQLARHGVRMGDVRYRAAYPSAHRSCRQGRPLPDEHDRRRQSQGARIFRFRPAASAISSARHQASDRPPAHQERAALPRPRDHRADRIDAGRLYARRRAPIPKAR